MRTRTVRWIEGRILEVLGKVKMSVTIINAGQQHNVVPEKCQFTVDIRTTDKYNNEQALAIIRDHVACEVIPRLTRLNPSFVPKRASFGTMWYNIRKTNLCLTYNLRSGLNVRFLYF